MKQRCIDYERVAVAIDYIGKNFKNQPQLEEIAAQVHLSPFHFQRLFTEWAGVSPKKFLQFLTIGYAKEILAGSKCESLFDAAAETGLSGSGRLHDLFVKIEGMTPGEFKNQGENLNILYSLGESHFGNYLVGSTGKGISNLYFYDGNPADAIDELKKVWKNAHVQEGSDSDHLKVANFFSNDLKQNDPLKLHLKGTDFQLKVWEALLKIPEGDLSTYGRIAAQLRQSNASRAVGTAIGSNQVGFIIPCHRVIKSVGGIGEFRWGTNRKKAMIGWEASQKVK